MANDVDAAEPLIKEEDTFENLRARATCPICKTFYTNPKQVCQYSHVFCLYCIKCYLEANSHVNFPGCPICRSPILKPIFRIKDLQPARAEKDIVEYVKQYETCGWCKQKQNPKLRCLECDNLICENCKPSHDIVKPSHTVNHLLHSASYNRKHTKQMCPQHPEMSLDLFCIVCQTQLCSYCEKFSHGKCQVRCNDQKVNSRIKFGFLQMCVKARVLQSSIRGLISVVYLKDFVKEAKSWLENVRIALDECINLYRELKSNLDAIIKDQFEPFASRIKAIMNDSYGILKKSETMHMNIVKLLENATDSEVARSVLHIEHKVVQLFLRRRKHSMEIRPLKLIFDKGAIFRQVSTGYLHVPDGAFAGMLCIAYSEPDDQICSEFLELKKDNNCTEAESNTSVHEMEIDKSVTVYHDIISVYETTERKLEAKSQMLNFKDYLTDKRYSFDFTSSKSMCFSNNTEYTNAILDRTNFRMLNITPFVHTIGIGYADYCASLRQFEHLVLSFYVRTDENESPRMAMTLPYDALDLRRFTIVTSFSNVFVVPFLFSVTGRYLYSDTDTTPSLICVIGNRDSVSGLETMFLYFDKTVQQSYGICLSTSIVKFSNLSSINLQNGHNFKSVKDKSSTFSFFSVEAEDLFMASIRTNTKCTAAPKNFLVAFDLNEKSERIIPVTFETVSLFCCTKKGLYFVKHDNKLDIMTIGKMSFSSLGMETEFIFSLKEADVGITICKLKPLTMVENRDNDIVVVCAVENDDKPNDFIMLWPFKEANNRVEVLEVQCPPTVLSNASVVDLEMDPDGNIMYVLENQEGQSQCVCTKYFMPK